MNKNVVHTKDLVYNKKFPTVLLVESVTLLDGYRVHLTFNNGQERDVDLEPIICGPVFEQIRSDPEYFRQVFVDPVGKSLTWPNGVDLDPESLYYGDEEPPWWTEYKKEQEQKKKKARQLRERAAHKKTATTPPVTKAKTRKKSVIKRTGRKAVLAKSK